MTISTRIVAVCFLTSYSFAAGSMMEIAIAENSLNGCNNPRCTHLKSGIGDQIFIDMLLAAYNDVLAVYNEAVYNDMDKMVVLDHSCNTYCKIEEIEPDRTQNERQYRDGFLAQLNREVANTNIEFLLARLLNNYFEVYGDISVVFHIDYDSFFSPQIHRFPPSDSEYYTRGRMDAISTINELKRTAYKEVISVSKRYMLSDRLKWRDRGEIVPESEFNNRILFAPYMQALIFFKENGLVFNSEETKGIKLGFTIEHLPRCLQKMAFHGLPRPCKYSRLAKIVGSRTMYLLPSFASGEHRNRPRDTSHGRKFLTTL